MWSSLRLHSIMIMYFLMCDGSFTQPLLVASFLSNSTPLCLDHKCKLMRHSNSACMMPPLVSTKLTCGG